MKSINGYTHHFTLTPMTPNLCRSCGRDPKIVFDLNNQFVIGVNEKAAEWTSTAIAPNASAFVLHGAIRR